MAEGKKLHIVLFPYPGFGHMLPYLNLSQYLAQKGNRVSFISTARNIKRLPKSPSSINFVELQFPLVENLPLGAEATVDLPPESLELLKKGYDGLAGPLEEYLRKSSPDWIIYDFIYHWLPPIANKLGIKQVFLSIFSATTSSFFVRLANAGSNHDFLKPEALTSTPDWIPFPTRVRLRLYEVKKLLLPWTKDSDSNSSGEHDMMRLISVIKGCDVIAVRSSFELESSFLKLLQDRTPKPVIPLGLMPHQANTVEEEDKEIRAWLDRQVKGSVVYVAFGTEAKISQEEFVEIARGLELSNLPFFWVQKEQDALRQVLPEGFEGRTRDRGLIWRGWVTQPKILSHGAIGGTMTHTGWSSVIEALQFGRPLIMLPFVSDQGLMARAMEEKGVGIEVPRDEESGRFTAEGVAESIRLVVVDEGGKVFRDKARETGATVGDMDLQQQYLEKFEAYLLQNV